VISTLIAKNTVLVNILSLKRRIKSFGAKYMIMLGTNAKSHNGKSATKRKILKTLTIGFGGRKTSSMCILFFLISPAIRAASW